MELTRRMRAEIMLGEQSALGWIARTPTAKHLLNCGLGNTLVYEIAYRKTKRALKAKAKGKG